MDQNAQRRRSSAHSPSPKRERKASKAKKRLKKAARAKQLVGQAPRFGQHKEDSSEVFWTQNQQEDEPKPQRSSFVFTHSPDDSFLEPLVGLCTPAAEPETSLADYEEALDIELERSSARLIKSSRETQDDGGTYDGDTSLKKAYIPSCRSPVSPQGTPGGGSPHKTVMGIVSLNGPQPSASSRSGYTPSPKS
jgi:hypothetical protein